MYVPSHLLHLVLRSQTKTPKALNNKIKNFHNSFRVEMCFAKLAEKLLRQSAA